MVLPADAAGDELDDQAVARLVEAPVLASRSAIRLLTQLILLLTFHNVLVSKKCCVFQPGVRSCEQIGYVRTQVRARKG